jgi:hypothetical protein
MLVYGPSEEETRISASLVNLAMAFSAGIISKVNPVTSKRGRGSF